MCSATSDTQWRSGASPLQGKRRGSLFQHTTLIQHLPRPPQPPPQPTSPASLPGLASWGLPQLPFLDRGSLAAGVYKMVGGNPGFPPLSPWAPSLRPSSTPWRWDSLGPQGALTFPRYFTANILCSLIPTLGSRGCHWSLFTTGETKAG